MGDSDVDENMECKQNGGARRRSSILKQRKSRNPFSDIDVKQVEEVASSKSVRRVSFASSNFVKPFVADDDKNTIWDATYEEEVNHTDSTKSSQDNTTSHQKIYTFSNISAVTDNTQTESLNIRNQCLNVTNGILATKENICPYPINGAEIPNSSIIYKLDELGHSSEKTSINSLQFICKSRTVEVTEVLSVFKDTTVEPSVLEEVDMDLTGSIQNENTNLSPKMEKSTAMEMTCQKPSNILNFNTTVENGMDFTCQVSQVEGKQPIITEGEGNKTAVAAFNKTLLDSSGMEFTCQLPTKPNVFLENHSSMNASRQHLQNQNRTDVLDKSCRLDTDMEFIYPPEARMSIATDMELSCQFAISKVPQKAGQSSLIEEMANVSRKKAPPNEIFPSDVQHVMDGSRINPADKSCAISTDMEFTCQIPTKKLKQFNDSEMEFTCQFPTNQLVNVVSVIDQKSTTETKCSKSKSVLSSSCKNKTAYFDKSAKLSSDMEFTCQLPSNGPEEIITPDMEFTCQVENRIEVDPSTSRSRADLMDEFSAMDVDSELSYQVPSVESRKSLATEMEFTCQVSANQLPPKCSADFVPVVDKENIMLCKDNVPGELFQNNKSLLGNKTCEMEFTCQIPATEVRKSLASDMEFTCQLSAKQMSKEKNSLASVSIVDKENMLCKNNKNVLQNKTCEMEFTCQIPTTEARKSLATDMEFTCQVSGNQLPFKEKNSFASVSIVDKENMPCKNDIPSEVIQNKNVLGNKTCEMEFTCQIPTTEARKSLATDMEFTCQVSGNQLPFKEKNSFASVSIVDKENMPCKNEIPSEVIQNKNVFGNKTCEMEFTCQIPTTEARKSLATDMEFTCQVSGNQLPFKEKNSFASVSIVDKENMPCKNDIPSEVIQNKNVLGNKTCEMEFTCQIPTAEARKSLATDMEFTCQVSGNQLPFKEKNSFASVSIVDKENMPCKNEIPSEVIQNKNVFGNKTCEMEFTCQIPTAEARKSLATDMEFTCQVSGNQLPFKEKNSFASVSIVDKENMPCKNEIPSEVIQNKNVFGNKTCEMEFTCQIPTTEVRKSHATDMEFTHQIPVNQVPFMEKNSFVSVPKFDKENMPCKNDIPSEVPQNDRSTVKGRSPEIELVCQIPTKRCRQWISNVESAKEMTVNDGELVASAGKNGTSQINNSSRLYTDVNTIEVSAKCRTSHIESLSGKQMEKTTFSSNSTLSTNKKLNDNVVVPINMDITRGSNKEAVGLSKAPSVDKSVDYTASVLTEFETAGNGKTLDASNNSNPTGSDAKVEMVLVDSKTEPGVSKEIANITKVIDIDGSMSLTVIDDTPKNVLYTQKVENPTNLSSFEYNFSDIKTPIASFNANATNMSPCFDDTQQLIHCPFTKCNADSFMASKVEDTSTKSDATRLNKTNKFSKINDTYVLKSRESHGKSKNVDTIEVVNKSNDGTVVSDDADESSLGLLSMSNLEFTPEKIQALHLLKPQIDEIEGSKLPIQTAELHRSQVADISENLILKCVAKALEKKCQVVDKELPDMSDLIRSIEDQYAKILNFMDNAEVKPLSFPMEFPMHKKKPIPVKLPDDKCGKKVEKCESLLDKIKNLESRSRNRWKFEETVNENEYRFSTLCSTLEFNVKVTPEGRVLSVTTRNCLSKNARPKEQHLMNQFLDRFDATFIKSSLGRSDDILSLLEYVQITMMKILSYETDLHHLDMNHLLNIDEEFTAKFKVVDGDLGIVCAIAVDLNNLKNISEDDVSVTAEIGHMDVNHIKSLMKECPKGLDFLRSYVDSVVNFLVHDKRPPKKFKSTFAL